jgi:hypothetical protein
MTASRRARSSTPSNSTTQALRTPAGRELVWPTTAKPLVVAITASALS